jgi:hypothetical protein
MRWSPSPTPTTRRKSAERDTFGPLSTNTFAHWMQFNPYGRIVCMFIDLIKELRR